jgi:DNA helicase-2/ATP-dependent DNA helicase PcrA
LDESGNKGLEEERRLAYVGLTRARRLAVISHAANRRIYANWQSSIPSRFIEEIPEEQVERAGSAAIERQQRLTAPSVFSGQFPLAARRPKITEVWEQPARPARPDALQKGQRVFHQKFGYGTVNAVSDDRLDVAFDKAGDKRVLDRFVERA